LLLLSLLLGTVIGAPIGGTPWHTSPGPEKETGETCYSPGSGTCIVDRFITNGQCYSSARCGRPFIVDEIAIACCSVLSTCAQRVRASFASPHNPMKEGVDQDRRINSESRCQSHRSKVDDHLFGVTAPVTGLKDVIGSGAQPSCQVLRLPLLVSHWE